MKDLIKKISATLLFMCIAVALFAQAPQAINYQSVVRNASGEVIASSSIGIEFSILQGSATGTAVYTETHSPSTNDFGLINLQLGTGTSGDDFSSIDWSSGPYFLEVSLDVDGGSNYSLMGTSELLSVPYALMAEDVMNDQVDDADADPTNEYNTSAVLSGQTLEITDGGGVQTVDLSVLVNDNDADSTNELQTISMSGNDLTLSEGGGVVNFNAYLDNTDAQNLTSSASGTNRTIDISGGTGATFNVADDDNDPTNEIQTLSFSGDQLSLTSGGNVVFPYDSSYWQIDGDTVYLTSHFTSVGSSEGSGVFHSVNDGTMPTNTAIVAESQTTGVNRGVLSQAFSTGGNSSTHYGVHGIAQKSSSAATAGSGNHYGGYFSGVGGGSFNHGVYANANSTGASNNRAFEGSANSSNASNNFGGIFFGTGAISGTNYGALGYAANGLGTNYGVQGLATGGSGTNLTGVYGYSDGSATFNAGVDGTTEATGATNIGAGGYAYGVTSGTNENYGVYAYAENAPTNYGLYATVTGASATNVGVYSEASNGVNNYAGYFVGDMVVTGDLQVTGSISKGSGTFKIDHPLDPENKYLVHSFVESPEMMNVYSGNITTDGNGYATVQLPEYFEVANKDFRYQLTVIGSFAQAIVAEEINGNEFVVQTDSPTTKVSWQVTGVRNDPYALVNRIVAEQQKEMQAQGTYLHPEVYGKPHSASMYGARGNAKDVLEIKQNSKRNAGNIDPVSENADQTP